MSADNPLRDLTDDELVAMVAEGEAAEWEWRDQVSSRLSALEAAVGALTEMCRRLGLAVGLLEPPTPTSAPPDAPAATQTPLRGR